MTVDSLDIQITTSLNNSNKALDEIIKKCGLVSSSLSKVSGTTSNFSSTMAKAAPASTKSFNGLASTFGKTYVNIRSIIRGIKSLNSSIQGTADYIESFNYYTVAMGKVASKWDKNWENYGDKNAQNYSNSFVKTMNETFSKLSGVSYDPSKGLISEKGIKNLGLNIKEITQYAAQLTSMMDSVGQNGEVVLATTDAFTRLAGDISSLYNIDYSSAATNIRSVLMGQSRAGYKFGWDTTVASLQAMADSLNLGKAVSEMTQMEKQQLRILKILQDSRVAWGDQANTINNLANQIRLFKNNLKETGIVFGQLFAPLFQKVLPYINGVTIAIKRLLTNIAGFLGVKFDSNEISSGFNASDDAMTDLSDSLDNVAESAKKAKAGLRGFDELKTINMPDSSGGASGLGGAIDLTDEILKATEEYEKVWQEAYDKMEQRAQKFADAVEQYLAPVKKLFQDIAIGDWFAVGQDVSNLVSGIFDFFSRAIESVNWNEIGNNIGTFLDGIDWTDVLSSVGTLIWDAINAAVDLWKGSFDAAPIETGIITAVALLSWTGLGKVIVEGILSAIGTGISLSLASAFAGIIVGIPTYFGGIYDAIQNGFDWLNGVLIPAGATAAGAGIGAIIGMLGGPIGAGIGALIGLAVGLVTDGVILIVEKWDSIKEWFAGIGEWFGTHVVEPIKKIWEPIADWFNGNVVKPIGDFFEGFSKRVSQIFEGLKIIVQAIWITVSTWFNDNVITPIVGFFAPIVEDISQFFENAWEKIKDIWKGVSTWFDKNIGEPLGKVWEKVTTKIKNLFSNLWSGIKSGVVNAMNSVIGAIEKGINFIVGAINKLIGGFNKIVSWAAKVAEVDWGGVDLVPKVSLTRIQAYEVGGFPERASLFWANENGIPELVGTMGGKTAVASGAEITGIKDAILQSSNRDAKLMERNNQLLSLLLEKEYGITDDQIGKSAQRYARDYFNRTGNEAYSF